MSPATPPPSSMVMSEDARKQRQAQQRLCQEQWKKRHAFVGQMEEGVASEVHDMELISNGRSCDILYISSGRSCDKKHLRKKKFTKLFFLF